MVSCSQSFSADSLVLGTALWGWRVTKEDAFSLLDSYVSLGGRLIDTAANYPINKLAKDMGLAAKWIGEWLSMNPSADIEVWYKMGAIDNLGSNNTDLSSTHLQDDFELSQHLMHGKIGVVGIHWDNRSDRNLSSIDETLEFFRAKSNDGLEVALSGIKNPKLYCDLWPEMVADWLIQVKDNALTSGARANYSKYFPRAKYYAYGINMGGVKSSAAPTSGSSLELRGLSPHSIVNSIEAFLSKENSISPSLKSLNDFALMRSFLIPQIYGVVLGPSSVKQLKQSFLFWRELHLSISSDACSKLSEFL